MKLEEKLKCLIKEEGNRVLTDQELALQLGITRQNVHSLRKKLEIPSSNNRLRPKLLSVIASLLGSNTDITLREMEEKIRGKEFEASSSLIYQIFKELKAEEDMVPNNISVKSDSETKQRANIAMEKLIGYNQSLKNQVVHAKAAVLYPPKGMDTIITGSSGVGKSYLAKCMYEYGVARGAMQEGKFIVFNCADYVDNSQLLYSQLFGHVKGAFTGADTDKKGLVALANGGMLFLDEVHRLPPEGQEMLFSVIDNGVYKRLGETESTHYVKLMIVAATTEHVESTLLATFRRRVPMIIELPSLKERTQNEKFEFIKLFIGREARQLNTDIEISYEACCALLSYNPQYNMGQLASNIKVIVAKAYLQYVTLKQNKVRITLDTIPPQITKNWIEGNSHVGWDFQMIPDKLIISGIREDKAFYDEEEDIYRFIDEKEKELKESNLTQKEIRQKLTLAVEKKVNTLIKNSTFNWDVNTQYYKGTNKQLIAVISDFLEEVQNAFPESNFEKNNLKYSLGFHIRSMLQRLNSGMEIIHPDLSKVKEENKIVFAMAKNLVDRLEDEFGIVIPEDEIGYISMYLNTAAKHYLPDDADVGVVIACHGKVASSMLDVAKYFIMDSNAVAVDMDLHVKPSEVYRYLVSAVREVDEGKGVLIMVDMGSLLDVGIKIQEETGIKVETLGKVNTMMLMDAMYWTKSKDKSLIDIKKIILNRSEKNSKLIKDEKELQPCIIIYCMTGMGAAKVIGDYLKEKFIDLEKKYKLIFHGIVKNGIEQVISQVQETMNVAAIIGNTYENESQDIPFFPIQDLYHGSSLSRFRILLGLTNKISLQHILSEEIILFNPSEKDKDGIIDRLAGELLEVEAISENFILDIREREAIITTYIGSGIALPHTLNRNNINYSQIALAVYQEPIQWDDYEVSVVCMFGVKTYPNQYFERLHKVLSSNFNRIIGANNVEEIKNILFVGN